VKAFDLYATVAVGPWIEQNEGAKFWLKVMNDLKARDSFPNWRRSPGRLA
jgi:hypothetical protein